MANKSRDNIRRDLELIRKLTDEDGLSDHEIMQQLQITEPTFYRYKRRLRSIYEKQWEKDDTANTNYSYARFHDALEECYRGCKKIIKDPHVSAHDKIDAYRTMCSAKQQIAQLDKKGPIFKPQLSNKVIHVNSKEITV